MPEKIRAYAATEAGGKLEPFECDPGELGKEQIEIKVRIAGSVIRIFRCETTIGRRIVLEAHF